MKKMRKGRKILLITLLAIIVLIVAVIIIKNVGNKKPETPIDDVRPIVQLPETTYSNMEVKNIQMEYLKEQDKTVLRFDIFNTTSNKVEEQFFDAVLIGSDENILAQMPYVYIQSLDVGQQHALEVVYAGDLTSTTQIKLIEK